MEFGVAGVGSDEVRLQVFLCPCYFKSFSLSLFTQTSQRFLFCLFVNLTFFALSLVYRAADLQPSAVEEVEEPSLMKKEGRYW